MTCWLTLALSGALAAVTGGAWAAPYKPTAEAAVRVQVLRISDGDTLWVTPLDDKARRTKVRIQGIDAPELCQAGGPAAQAALQRWAQAAPLSMTVTGRDQHGRVLARLHSGTTDVGEALVREGQAWSYRFRDDPGPYAAQERQARQAKRGLHADVSALHPRDFRRRHGPCDDDGRAERR
ncbi:thermonuclease family protein [Ideonella paludis]|uniref:Thermonuclease family protein n=1 Tax=Ideonella paludis TaxID=1233411 RepID=A0ABS5DY38_9BURK|nr:thermonuclease family protein [Ideonella paludis]MBQ0936065.1 thermonuclease family protein [Ideonella paludis]